MYEFAKIVGFLISPLTIALMLWGLSLLFLWGGHKKIVVVLSLAGFAGLWVAGMPVASYALTASLEKQYPVLKAEARPRTDAIVVLGGGLTGASPPRRPEFDMGAGSDRVWHAAAIYHAGKARWIVVTGGNQPGAKNLETEADAMAQMLIGLRVPDSAILREGRSRNTHENARFSRPLLESIQARRVLLVTSALHMPRALKVFAIHLAGTNIVLIPAATDVEALPNTLHPVGKWLPDARCLTMTTSAIREYVGLLSLYFMR